ncbi:MAG: 3-dehydroquinate synthase, partial [Desulfobacterales bacterium]|nr:3-dehydroquinate synthase [Desulfobacterales bacterium]
ERRKLNFGHTFGHAIEKTAKLPHGESVSIGMVIASRLSQNKGLLSETDTGRIQSLLEKLNLPTRLRMDKEKMLRTIMKDKKKEGDHLYFVLINSIGNALIDTISISDLEDVFEDLNS